MRHQNRKVYTLALALALSLPLAGAAQPAEPRVDAVTVEHRALARPLVRSGAKGLRQAYGEVWVVHVQGRFPRVRDEALRLYVGDWEVPEYGGAPDGLYFKVYDPERLAALRGRELRYRLGSRPVRGLGVRLGPEAGPLQVP